jgi:hypothetical protein
MPCYKTPDESIILGKKSRTASSEASFGCLVSTPTLHRASANNDPLPIPSFRAFQQQDPRHPRCCPGWRLRRSFYLCSFLPISLPPPSSRQLVSADRVDWLLPLQVVAMNCYDFHTALGTVRAAERNNSPALIEIFVSLSLPHSFVLSLFPFLAGLTMFPLVSIACNA